MQDDRPQPSPATTRARGLRLLDLVGFVAGFGLAALLTRTVWPRAAEATGPPAVALAMEFAWLGLAMSGPILLGLDPRRPGRPSSPPRRPERPGRLISEVAAGPRHPAPPPPALTPEGSYTRAELTWMAIGGYWIALTFFVVPARATNAPWTLAGLIPVVVILCLIGLLPRRTIPAGTTSDHGWTHGVAVGLLWTWPVAWALLVLLGRTI